VLPVLAKVLEYVLQNQIQVHLMEYGILYSHQSGFCAGYSTQDVLTDKWMKAVDDGKCTGTVILELAKAFDTVNHFIL